MKVRLTFADCHDEIVDLNDFGAKTHDIPEGTFCFIHGFGHYGEPNEKENFPFVFDENPGLCTFHELKEQRGYDIRFHTEVAGDGRIWACKPCFLSYFDRKGNRVE